MDGACVKRRLSREYRPLPPAQTLRQVAHERGDIIDEFFARRIAMGGNAAHDRRADDRRVRHINDLCYMVPVSDAESNSDGQVRYVTETIDALWQVRR